MTAVYTINNLIHTYHDGRGPALILPELTVRKGAILGLAGPNGTGKSTLLKILAFLMAPTRGTILFNEAPVPDDPTLLRRRATLMLQNPLLLRRSVFENTAYGLRVRKDVKQLRARVREALELVGLAPEEFASRPRHMLSGGEAQRVALASRLILKPEVLLLDEPTSNLDVLSATRIRQAVLKARELWGTTIVAASHDHEWLADLADDSLPLG